MTEGDHLHELYIVLAGLVETFKPGIAESVEDISLNMGETGEGSFHGNSISRSASTVDMLLCVQDFTLTG